MLTELEGSILRLIRDNPGISRLDIAKRLGVSKPVITNVVARLIDKGLVRESGTVKTKVGRPKVTLQFVPNAWYCVGAELEERYFELIVTDLSGQLIDSCVDKIDSFYGPDGLIRFCQERIKGTLEKTSIPQERILGVGVGIAGMVDPNTGLVRTAPALGLTNFDLASTLSDALRLNVVTVNRVKAAALAEHRLGAARGFENVLFVFIDSGLGCAALFNGRIYEGFYGKAGELGWMITDLDRSEPEMYEEQSFGHLARRFSGHALSRRLENLKQDIDRAFEIGFEDQSIVELLRRGLKHVAAAIANAVLLFDPQLIIIKGRIGQRHYERVAEVIFPTLKQILPVQFQENMNLRRGQIEKFDVALGAVFAVQQKLMRL